MAGGATMALTVNPTQFSAHNTVSTGLSVASFTNYGIYLNNKASGGTGVVIESPCHTAICAGPRLSLPTRAMRRVLTIMRADEYRSGLMFCERPF
jgi:hypothetical protein